MNHLSRDNLVVLGILALLVAVAVFGVYMPQASQAAEYERAIHADQVKIEQTEHQISVVPTMARRVEAMRLEYKDFDRKLPKRKELGDFLRQINASLAEQDLANKMIQTGQPSAEGRFQRLPITMQFSGEYLPLCTFLDRMAKTRRLAQVRQLSITRDEKGKLDIDLQMNIYFKES
jgi:Tfp pilus assembly protein PilO